MKQSRLILAAVMCLALLLSGTATAAAAGFEDTELEFDTGAVVDFGFGETDYVAIGTVPARVREDADRLMYTAFVAGLRYTKVDPLAPGPAYFDITDGTFRASGSGDPMTGFGKFQWQVELMTDDGDEYRSNGMIFDRNRTEDRDVWRWNGPIIEP